MCSRAHLLGDARGREGGSWGGGGSRGRGARLLLLCRQQQSFFCGGLQGAAPAGTSAAACSIPAGALRSWCPGLRISDGGSTLHRTSLLPPPVPGPHPGRRRHLHPRAPPCWSTCHPHLLGQQPRGTCSLKDIIPNACCVQSHLAFHMSKT